MASFEPQCLLESAAFDTLRERGWKITDGRRSGVDLDLDVELHDGTRGKVLFRNAFEAGRAVDPGEPSPIFLRVDLGEPHGEPTRWAVWDQYAFPGGKNTPAYVAVVIHEAIGDGWASTAGCSMAPNHPWYDFRAVAPVFARAESLAPNQDEPSRNDQIFGTQRRNFGVQRPRWAKLVGAAILLPVAAGLWAMMAHVAAQSASSATAHVAAMSMVGLPALVSSIVGLVLLVQHVRVPRKPLPAMTTVVDLLRSTGAFTTVTTPPLKRRDGLPLPIRTNGYLQNGAAPLSVSRLSATSSLHGVKLEADLSRWPGPREC